MFLRLAVVGVVRVGVGRGNRVTLAHFQHRRAGHQHQGEAPAQLVRVHRHVGVRIRRPPRLPHLQTHMRVFRGRVRMRQGQSGVCASFCGGVPVRERPQIHAGMGVDGRPEGVATATAGDDGRGGKEPGLVATFVAAAAESDRFCFFLAFMTMTHGVASSGPHPHPCPPFDTACTALSPIFFPLFPPRRGHPGGFICLPVVAPFPSSLDVSACQQYVNGHRALR